MRRAAQAALAIRDVVKTWSTPRVALVRAVPDEMARFIERRNTMEFFRDQAVDQFERHTGSAWRPRTGSLVNHRTLTASLIDSRDFLVAKRREETEVLLPVGPKIAFTGGLDFNDHRLIWERLDRVHAKHPDMVLLHGGSPKGAERIAACWADQRKVPQIAFKPDWTRHAKAAPFKRNDQMLDAMPIGVMVFPGTGIQDNLADKARRPRHPGVALRRWRRVSAACQLYLDTTSVLQAGRPLSDAVIATLPRCTRDRALTGGEAAPLDQPWRASHRSGHDDAKALLQAHRHVISRGSRRTGDAELFAGGQDAQQIFLHGWMAGLAPQSHRHRHVPGACPDGADAPHLTQNVAYVLHPFCFFDDAHQ